MTWITPFEAPTFAFTIRALLTFTTRRLTLTFTRAPFSVLMDLRFTTLRARSSPLATW